MGISALWISSPVENIMIVDPSNNCASYHGYWAKDFFKNNSAFGDMDDFTDLITTAHDHGIKVIIDFAPNHTSTAEYSGYTFPEDGALYRNGTLVGSFSSDSAGIFNHESWTDYSTLENGIYHSLYGLADLNQMNSTVDTYLKEAINKWLDLGVDGIRVDAVKHMPEGWQKNWLSSIYEDHNVFVFGEWFNGGTSNDSDMTSFANDSGMSLLDFRYANAVRNAIGSESITMKDLYQVMVDTESDYDEVKDQVTFIDNHDMSRFMTLSKNDQADVNQAYVMLLTSRGVPTIYYGSEQYMTGTTDPYNRGDMTSFNQTSTAYNIISKIAPLRKSNPALAYGTSTQRWVNDDVLIYERQFGNNVVLTAVNRNDNKSYDISGLFTNLPSGTYNDVLNGVMSGNDITVSTTGAVTDFTLGGGECAVWQYSTVDNSLNIGNINPGIGISGNTVSIVGQGYFFTPYDTNGKVLELPDDGIILSSSTARDLDVTENDYISILTAGKRTYLKVTQIADMNSPQGIFMSQSYWESLGNTFTASALLADDNMNLDDVKQMSVIKDSVTLKKQYSESEELLDSVQGVIILLIAAAILLSIVIQYNLGLLNFTEKYREYATLRVLGSYNKEIKNLILKSSLITMVTGWIIGSIAGWYFLGLYVRTVSTTTISYSPHLRLVSYIIVSLIVVGCSLLIQLMVCRLTSHIDMVESLKSIE